RPRGISALKWSAASSKISDPSTSIFSRMEVLVPIALTTTGTGDGKEDPGAGELTLRVMLDTLTAGFGAGGGEWSVSSGLLVPHPASKRKKTVQCTTTKWRAVPETQRNREFCISHRLGLNDYNANHFHSGQLRTLRP